VQKSCSNDAAARGEKEQQRIKRGGQLQKGQAQEEDEEILKKETGTKIQE